MADATADPLHAHSDDSGSENGHRTTEASTKAVTPEPTAAPAPSPAAADNTASSTAPPPTTTPRESSVVRHEAKEYGGDDVRDPAVQTPVVELASMISIVSTVSV